MCDVIRPGGQHSPNTNDPSHFHVKLFKIKPMNGRGRHRKINGMRGQTRFLGRSNAVFDSGVLLSVLQLSRTLIRRNHLTEERC